MKLRNNTLCKPGRLGRLLSRRDWAYVLALLVPFVAYDLALKIVRVASLSDERDPDELGSVATIFWGGARRSM